MQDPVVQQLVEDAPAFKRLREPGWALLHGHGLEIGALHERAPLPSTCVVEYVDAIKPIIDAYVARFHSFPLDMREAIYRYLEMGDFPDHEIRNQVMMLEQLYEKRYQRPLMDKEDSLFRLLNQVRDSEADFASTIARLQQSYERQYRPMPQEALAVTTVLSTAAFALAHGSLDPWILLELGSLAFFGCYLAWRTGGLEAVIVIHVINNILILVSGALLGGLAESYVDGTEIGEIACAGRVGALAVLTQPVEPGHSLQLGTDRLVVMVADVIAGAS